MNVTPRRIVMALGIGIGLGLSGTPVAHAQSSRSSAWQPFVSITGVWDGDADLDSGGDFDVTRVLLRAGIAGDLGGGNRAGLTLNYDHNDFSFANPAAFGGVAPWGTVQRYGVAVPLHFALQDGWSVGITPSVDWFRENGADTGESLVWGAVIAVNRQFAHGNRLGLGVAAFQQIEETSVLPIFLIDWRLGERWRLINPLPSGPTGPAGLELDYDFGNGWTLGLGGAFRKSRFRLSENGPVANGVGEEAGVPVFLRASRSFGQQLSLHVYAGVVTGGHLRVETSSGQYVREEDYDTVPLLGVTFSGRF